MISQSSSVRLLAHGHSATATGVSFLLAKSFRFCHARRMKSLLLAFSLAVSAAAADDQGFTPLFNGRDLTGWVNANCAPETWSVTNGLIHCTGHPTGAMRTERQYENFILEADWRHLSSGGNSGIFIWGTPIAAPGVPFLRGIEVQVLDHGYSASGKNQWYTTHGDVFPIHGATMNPFGRHNGQRSFPSEERSKPSPEWNHYQIVCSNGTIRLSVNGKEVSGGENCNYRKGYLALESEGAPVEFRDIRIKELPSSNPAPGVVAPVDQGFRAIFTGLDLRGWKSSEQTAARWNASGERIRLKPGVAGTTPPATLWSEKAFGDLELILDVRPPKDGAGTLPFVCLRGSEAGKIELRGAEKGASSRFKVTVKNRTASVQRENGETWTVELPSVLPARGPIGLGDTLGQLEFMNLYVRENL